ncbi:hypothetical protein U9M48_004205 [Paspalum notatum var. saurae]|uniref:Uncharacterized protein n=1 Tax=Paspalum notatum var. saurae TaxID=547442 RepID=A0AAQ3PST3_PASNO
MGGGEARPDECKEELQRWRIEVFMGATAAAVEVIASVWAQRREDHARVEFCSPVALVVVIVLYDSIHAYFASFIDAIWHVTNNKGTSKQGDSRVSDNILLSIWYLTLPMARPKLEIIMSNQDQK